MMKFVALVAYGCTVAGEGSSSVDFQVRLFEADSVETVEQALQSEPPHEYENEGGQVVSWPLARILDIQALEPSAESGVEVAGAITTLESIASHLPGSAA